MVSASARAGLIATLLFALLPARAQADAATDVETWVRLKGDAAGAITYEWVRGAAFGVPVDGLSRPLFQIESVTVRQIRRFGAAHFIEQNYACRLYRDAATGAYIDRFINPFTQREVALPGRCSPGPAVRYTAERVTLVSNTAFESSALNAPMRLERIPMGEQIVVRREAHSQYRSQASGEIRRETSVDTFTVSARELANPRNTNLAASYQWTSVTQWAADFGMADTPGRMLWTVNGRKYSKPRELPPAFRAALERAVPGALERAFDWSAFDASSEGLSAR